MYRDEKVMPDVGAHNSADNFFIIKHKKEVDYTTIYNDCINDKRLSAECLSILVYVMSKPDDWKILIKNLSNRFNLGRNRVYSSINDLISSGYMKRIQPRNTDGSMGERLIYASDKPIFLTDIEEDVTPLITEKEIKLIDKQPLTETREAVTVEKADKQPLPEIPEAVNREAVPYIQKKDLTNNNNNNLSTVREDAPTPNSSFDPVVVFLLDKIRNFPNFDISEEQMDEWVIKYGKVYVEEKIELMTSKTKIASQGGYLRSALTYNWKKGDSGPGVALRSEIKMVPEGQSPVRQESVNYNEDWFRHLSAEQKTKVYEGAVKAFPFLEQHLKLKNLSVLDDEFEKSCWFKTMVDSFKSYNGVLYENNAPNLSLAGLK